MKNKNIGKKIIDLMPVVGIVLSIIQIIILITDKDYIRALDWSQIVMLWIIIYFMSKSTDFMKEVIGNSGDIISIQEEIIDNSENLIAEQKKLIQYQKERIEYYEMEKNKKTEYGKKNSVGEKTGDRQEHKHGNSSSDVR